MHALSPTDSAFMWMETRNQPMHVAGLNLYTPPANEPGFVAELLAHWATHLKALPPFNMRPVLRMGLWYWEEDKHFEVDYHLRHLALPQPGRIRELLAIVSRLHGNLLDRNRPLWEAYVIEGLPGGRFATYIKIHHALVDGVTAAKMMAQALSHQATVHKGPLWSLHYPKHPTSRPARAPLSLAQQLAQLASMGRDLLPGVASALKDMVGSDQDTNAPARAFQAPASLFNVEISGSRRFAAQSYSLPRLKRLGEASGATVNDVTLAICAGALRQYLLAHQALPSKPLIAMVPVSLHAGADVAGNQVSVLLANLATHIADPLKRLQRIVQSTGKAKERLTHMPRLQKLSHGLTSISPMGVAMVTGAAKKHPVFNVVISNVPGPTDTLYMNGAQLDEVYPVSIATHYLALNITITGYGDKLGFGYIACRRSVPGLQRMLDYTDQAIEELELALGLQGKPAVMAKPIKAPRKRARIMEP
ncbi:WS/DGAT/MGAT family O-acyltransferase [Rhodoferax aquaticus]|nr:wax ester/triacylglycerol synthase family O-acyltransferase [Rhodoferax aquaticus]